MRISRNVWPIIFVGLSFLVLYLITLTDVFLLKSEHLCNLITVDIILIIPFVYFLGIRKSNIPNLTVIPVLILGIVLASFILPESNQTYLNQFKIYILPFIEIGILSLIIFKATYAINKFRANSLKGADFYSNLKATCYNLLPKFIAEFLTTEVSVIYYGFFYWKKRPLNSHEFSYHKLSGSIGLYIILIIIIIAETLGLHALLKHSNPVLSWILFIISIYTALQFFGFGKSIIYRPIIIENNTLYLRYGIMKEATIALKNIVAADITSKDLKFNSEAHKFSLLGSIESHNVILHFKTPQIISGLYGLKKECKSLALSIDDIHGFLNSIEKYR